MPQNVYLLAKTASIQGRTSPAKCGILGRAYTANMHFSPAALDLPARRCEDVVRRGTFLEPHPGRVLTFAVGFAGLFHSAVPVFFAEKNEGIRLQSKKQNRYFKYR